MVREHIRECFSSVSCFLMPSPGSKVQSGDSDGRLSGEWGRRGEEEEIPRLSFIRFSLTEMDSSFKQHLKEFAPILLSLSSLVPKAINGVPLTGKTLFDIFGVCMKHT